MNIRTFILLFATFLIVSCALNNDPAVTSNKEQEVLYIYHDGTIMFKGRKLNEKDVVIYDAGSKGERAGIKILLPLHPDAYRDNVAVERVEKVEIVVPIVRK